MKIIPRLKPDKDQKQTLANIAISASQVSSGSVVIPLALSGLAPSNIPMIILGTIITISLWGFSYLIIRKKRPKK